jgi:homoserine O-acetyltransferase
VTVTSTIQAQTTDAAPPAQRGEFEATIPLAYAGPLTLPVRYELVGAEGSSVVVVAGGISAGRHVFANRSDPDNGWWQGQARIVDDQRVLSIDWIGSDGLLDQPIDAADQARAIMATLDKLGISKITAFIGASYGAMVGMHCAAIAPGRVRALLAISGSDRAHPFASAQRALQRHAIELGERLGSAQAGVALARKLAILSYRTPEEFAERFKSPVVIEGDRALASAEPYLNHMGERHSVRMSAVAYRRLSESIDLHRIDPARLAVPSTFVAITSDQLVPTGSIELLARAVPQGRFVSLPSIYGHDAFLKEDRAIAAIIRDFLNSLEQPQ